MKFISPIKRYKGLRVRVSQPFGVNPQLYAQFKDALGNSLRGHNGIDLCLGADPQLMYGANLNSICDGSVSQTIWDNPMSTKGNGVYITTPVETDAMGVQRYYLIVYWHLMEIDVKAGQQVKMGDNLGDMGNSGFVNPQPTNSQPYLGTHLHLGIYPCVLDNGVWKKEFPNNGFDGACDPLPLIGDLNPAGWEMKDTLENILNRIAPIRWAIEKIKELFKGRR